VNFRKAIVETLAYLTLIAGLLIVWAICANAQAPTLCGRESTVGSVRVLIICQDWPAMRAATGFAGFPDLKGQQVFMRSTDPSVTGFRVNLTYRKEGETITVTLFSPVNDKYDSGVGWVLGDVEIITVRVIELRDVSAAVIQ